MKKIKFKEHKFKQPESLENGDLKIRLTKITTELTCAASVGQPMLPGQYARALFHFESGDITFGAKREALYKSKDNKRTIMYLKCVNYSPVRDFQPFLV